MRINKLKKRLKNGKIIILSGACGTELQRRGIKTELPLWSARALIDNPKLVREVHEDYIRSGAQVITTNTFRTQTPVFKKVGLENKAHEFTLLACKCARDAVRNCESKEVCIAGSMAPLEDCYEPSLVLPNDILTKVHGDHARSLVEGKVDLILIETMNSIREAEVASEVAKNTGSEIIVSFVCNENGLLSGESIEEAFDTISVFDPLAISLNCSAPHVITKPLKRLLKISRFPVGVYANGEGKPSDNLGWEFSPNMTPKKYGEFVREWINLGVQFIGGCCGTNPLYIKEIKKIVTIYERHELQL